MVYAAEEALREDSHPIGAALGSVPAPVCRIVSRPSDVTDSQRGKSKHDELGCPTSLEPRVRVDAVRQ